MGVANQRSIAMSCMESFLQKGDWDIVYTVQNETARSKVQRIIEKEMTTQTRDMVLGDFVCDVADPRSTEVFFREILPEVLHNHQGSLEAVIHSIAFAPDLRKPLMETSREAFLEAHNISAYSLIEVARESLPLLGAQDATTTTTSITTLSYLGAERAIPGYHAMGPAKASLESIVRGLSLELGQHNPSSNMPIIRVNAVRAGPIPTLSSKGGIAGFHRMRQDVHTKAPLGNISVCEVGATVYHVAAEATGITGQTINIDGGYSVVGGPTP